MGLWFLGWMCARLAFSALVAEEMVSSIEDLISCDSVEVDQAVWMASSRALESSPGRMKSVFIRSRRYSAGLISEGIV